MTDITKLQYFVDKFKIEGNNPDLVGLSETGTKVLNGKWVRIDYTIANGVTIQKSSAVTTFDLTQALPRDNNTYEVIISMETNTGSTTVSNSYVYTDIIPAHRAYVNAYITRTGFSLQTLVGPQRRLSVYNTNDSTYTLYAYMRAYRRIGTCTL